jgi:hypothetical protein
MNNFQITYKEQERYLNTGLVMVLLLICLHTAWTHISLIEGFAMKEIMDSNVSFPTLEDFANFESRPPFSFRILVPTILSYVQQLSPNLKTGLNFPVNTSLNVAMLVIDWISILIASYFTYRIAKREVGISSHSWFAIASPFLLIWMIYYNYITVPNRNLFYPYDFPELAFCAAICWVIFDPRPFVRASLILLIPLATLNKETALFFLLLFIVVRLTVAGLNRNDVLIFLSSAILGAFAKYFTYSIGDENFQELTVFVSAKDVNKSAMFGLFEMQLFDNLRQLLKPLFWFSFISNYGYLWIILFFRRRWINTRLCINILMTISLWFIIMFFLGVSRELRIFGPMFFLLLWLLGYSLKASDLHNKQTSRSAQRVAVQPG